MSLLSSYFQPASQVLKQLQENPTQHVIIPALCKLQLYLRREKSRSEVQSDRKSLENAGKFWKIQENLKLKAPESSRKRQESNRKRQRAPEEGVKRQQTTTESSPKRQKATKNNRQPQKSKTPERRITADRSFSYVCVVKLCFESYTSKFLWAVASISLIRFSWFTSLAPGS